MNSFKAELEHAQQLLATIDSHQTEWESDTTGFHEWVQAVVNLLRRTYGEKSVYVQDFGAIMNLPSVLEREIDQQGLRAMAPLMGQSLSPLRQDIWNDTMSRARGFLNTLLQDMEARIDSEGTTATLNSVPRRYVLTSPVFLLEKTTNMLKNVPAWLKLHKIVSLLLGAIFLLAAILTILSFLGVNA